MILLLTTEIGRLKLRWRERRPTSAALAFDFSSPGRGWTSRARFGRERSRSDQPSGAQSPVKLRARCRPERDRPADGWPKGTSSGDPDVLPYTGRGPGVRDRVTVSQASSIVLRPNPVCVNCPAGAPDGLVGVRCSGRKLADCARGIGDPAVCRCRSHPSCWPESFSARTGRCGRSSASCTSTTYAHDQGAGWRAGTSPATG